MHITILKVTMCLTMLHILQLYWRWKMEQGFYFRLLFVFGFFNLKMFDFIVMKDSFWNIHIVFGILIYKVILKLIFIFLWWRCQVYCSWVQYTVFKLSGDLAFFFLLFIHVASTNWNFCALFCFRLGQPCIKCWQPCFFFFFPN